MARFFLTFLALQLTLFGVNMLGVVQQHVVLHWTMLLVRTCAGPVTQFYCTTVAAGKVRTAQVLLLIVRQALSWAEKRQPWRLLLIAGNPADLITEDSITPPDYKSESELVLSPAEIQ